MKLYIIYRSEDHGEAQAIALTREAAEKMLRTLLSHHHSQTMWIEEKTITKEAIEI